MKTIKTCLMLLALIAFGTNAEAKHIYYSATGSEDGIHYDRVTEEHSGTINKSHSLICKDPGASICGWQWPPSVGGYGFSAIKAYVDQQIANSNHSGSTNFNGTVTLSWNYDPNTDHLEIWAND